MSIVLPVVFLAVGLGAGALHFVLLRRNTTLFAHGNAIPAALALQLGRMALTVAVLVFAARNGQASLLACALGVLLARQAVVRRAEGASP